MWLSEALDGGPQFQVPFKPVSDASRGSARSQTTPRFKSDMELPSGPAFGTRDAYATNLINSNDFLVVRQTHEDFFIDGAVVKRAKDTRIHAE